MTSDKYRKILVRMPGGIKCMIDALPILTSLRAGFPRASIYILVQENMEGIVRNFENVFIVPFNKHPRFAPTLKDGEDVITFIQKKEFDLGILCTYSFSSAYMFYQGMVKRIIGFTRTFGSFMLTDAVPRGSNEHLLLPLGLSLDTHPPKIVAKSNKQCFLTIGLCCSLQEETLKRKWYLELSNYILDLIPHVKISILGFVSDSFDIDSIVQGRVDSIFDKTAERSLTDMIDLIHNLDVYVSDNEDIIALASAVDTPSVNIKRMIENSTLLPEDFFHLIKDALLQSLKDTSNQGSFNDYKPIKEEELTKASPVYAKKRVGVIILAGGMGRRLGLDKAKGLLTLGERCLYDILLEKSKSAEKLGMLTSPLTYSETKDYCSGKEINLFYAKAYPTESGDSVSPEGNGSLFDALVHSEHWKQWRKLDLISVIAVDNPLADPLDPELLASDKQLTVIGVERDKQESKLGVLCKSGDFLAVREYFTLGKDGLEGLGYSGSFAAMPEFFEKVCTKNLPFYRIEKNNEVFFERLLIDGFLFAKDFQVICKKRKDCFFPIKEKADVIAYCKRENIEEKVK